MNETTSFFSSWGFWFILGLLIGGIVGFFTAAICAASGQASRDEEYLEWQADARSEIADMKKIIESSPITNGRPDRV